jgi:isocitrate dehydrogenase
VVREEGAELSDGELLDLLQKLSAQLRWMHVEKLQESEGRPGWTRAQGQN